MFVMVKFGVLFEVRTEFLDVIKTNFGFKAFGTLKPDKLKRNDVYLSVSLKKQRTIRKQVIVAT
jgi:hypothetical protein